MRREAGLLFGALVALSLSACKPSPGGEPATMTHDRRQAPRSSESGPLVRFEATVIAPAAEGQRGKRMRGALVKQDDGTEWAVDYRADSPFRELAGRRVVVEGARYEPEGQALLMPHLRVRSMTVVNPDEGAALVSIGAEERLSGRFERYTFPEGTKLAGETFVRFVDDAGTTYWLSHGGEEAPVDERVTVTARRVEPSPFIARPGGPYLWVQGVERR